MILDDVKTLLGISDDLQDDQLNLIIDMTSKKLLKRLAGNPVQVPEPLEYIVVEASIMRFNKLGSEALKQNSVEGHSMTWYDTTDFLKLFQDEIDEWNKAIVPVVDADDGWGKVVLF